MLMKIYQLISIFYLLTTYSVKCQQYDYPFLNEINKDEPNLFIADSLYNVEVSKITKLPIKKNDSFTHHRELGSAFNEYYHWRNNYAYLADADGDIIHNDSQNIKISSKKKSKQNSTSTKSNSFITSTNNILDWKIQTSNIWNYMGPWDSHDMYDNSAVDDVQSTIVAIDRSKSNPKTIICATQFNGAFKSIDNGKNWFSITTNLDINSILDVVIHPEDENFIALVDPYQIYVSQDGGNSYQIANLPPISNLGALFPNFSLDRVTKVAIIPNKTLNDKPLILIAARWGTFSYDIDTNTVSSYSKVDFPSSDIVMSPVNNDIIYILTYDISDNRQIVYKSEDRGNSWTNKDGNGWLSVPTGSTEILKSHGGKIALSETNPDLIYVYLIGQYSSNEDNGYIGLFRSNDGGNTWTLTDSEGPGKGLNGYNKGINGGTHLNLAASYATGGHQAWWNIALAVHPTNDDEVIAGGMETYRTEDGGASWIRLAGGANLGLHADVQAAQSMIVNGDVETFITNDGGITFSKDFFRTAPEIRNYGLPSDFWGIDVAVYNSTITGGRFHNGNVSYLDTFPNPYTWKFCGGAEAATGLIYFANDERAAHWSDTEDGIISTSITEEKGFLANLSPLIRQERYTPTLGTKKTLSGIFYYFNKHSVNDLYKITGPSKSMFLHTFSTKPYSMEPCASNENYIYTILKSGTGNNDRSNILSKTTDGGMTWNTVYTFSENLNFRLQVDDQKPDHIWAYGQDSSIVYESNDGGVTFNQLALPPGDISELVYQWSSNNIYAFKTKTNLLYRYEIDTDTWYNYSSGLPLSSTPLVLKIMYSEKKLILANKGLGLWTADLYSESNAITPFATILNENSIGFDKLNTFTFDSKILSSYTPTYEWTTNCSNAVINTPTSKSTNIVFNEYGIFDVTLNLYDTSTNLTNSLTKKVYIYPGCSFDGKENNVLIPLNNLDLWIKGDDIIKEVSNSTYDNYITDVSLKDHGFANACGLPLKVKNYNNSSYNSFRLSGDSYCRIEFDKEYTHGKTFFFVGHEYSGSANRARPYFGHDTDSYFINNSTNILNLVSKPNFDLVKLNGSDITSTVNTIRRPTIPSLTTFRVKDGLQVNVHNISRNKKSNSNVWKGEVAEVIIYNERLSDTEIDKVEQYLINKYNLIP